VSASASYHPSDDRGDLLRPLRDIDGADDPPPRYDVALAMRQGDAIRRRRMSIGAVAAIVVVGAAIGIPIGLPSRQHAEPTPAPSASVPTSSPSPLPRSTEPADLPVANCTVGTLTAPAAAGAFTSWINPAIDPTGRYVVTTLIKSFRLPFANVVPTKAMLVDLRTGTTTLFRGSDTGATAVNASGVVVGSSGSDGAGWVFRNGKVSQLPKFHGVAATPLGINARGDILGMVYKGQTETSVIWPAANPGTVRALLPANFLANTISDTGSIGGAIGPFDKGKPYVGDGNGNGHTLPTGLADTQGNVFQIRGDYAVGEGPIFAGRFPVVWNLTTGSLVTYPNISLRAIADDGTTVGAATTTTSDGYTSIGLVGRSGQLQRLPTGHGDSPPVYEDAAGITEDGHTILGTDRKPVGTDGPFSQVALVWHC
jgi:hypothetical protein